MTDAEKIADLTKDLGEANKQLQKSINEANALRRELTELKTKEKYKADIIPAKSYDGSTDINEFLMNFTELATIQEWSDSRQRVILLNKLEGEALTVALSERTENAAQLKALLKKSFGPADITVYSLQLQNRVQKKGEAFDHLARDLKHLGHKAYPKADDETLDALLKECFINAVSDEGLRSMIRFKEPGSLTEASKVAERLSVHTEQEKRLLKKNLVKTVSQTNPEKTEVVAAAAAAAEDTMESQVRQLTERLKKLESKQVKTTQKKKSTEKSQKKGPPTCFHCQMPGHIRKYCPFAPENVQKKTFPVVPMMSPVRPPPVYNSTIPPPQMKPTSEQGF